MSAGSAEGDRAVKELLRSRQHIKDAVHRLDRNGERLPVRLVIALRIEALNLQFNGRCSGHLVDPRLRLKLGDGDRLVVDLGRGGSCSPLPDQRVGQELSVVALWEVLAAMSAA